MRVDNERGSLDIERRDITYILPAYIRLYLFQTRNVEPKVITIPMFSSIAHNGKVYPIEYVPEDSPIALEIQQDGEDIPEPTPESEAVADEKEKTYDELQTQVKELEAELAKAKDGVVVPMEICGRCNRQFPVEDLKDGICGTCAQDLMDEQAAQEGSDQHDNTAADETLSPARQAFANVEPPADSELEYTELTESDEDHAARHGAVAGVSEDQPSAERLSKLSGPPGGALPDGTQSDYGRSRDARDQSRIARDLRSEPDINEDEEISEEEFQKRKAEKEAMGNQQ